MICTNENARRQPGADTSENSRSDYTAQSVRLRRLFSLIVDCAIAGDDAIVRCDDAAFKRTLADLNRNIAKLRQVWRRK